MPPVIYQLENWLKSSIASHQTAQCCPGIASSENSIAVPSSETFAALWEKHPLLHPDSAIH